MEDFAASPRSAVLVISYEMLLRSVERVAQLDFGIVICDEGHRLKNSGIKTSAALSGLRCVRRVILTGQWVSEGRVRGRVFSMSEPMSNRDRSIPDVL